MVSSSINNITTPICTYNSSERIQYYTFFSEIGEQIGNGVGFTAKVYFSYRAYRNLILDPVTRGNPMMLYARRIFDFALLTNQFLTFNYNKMFHFMSVPGLDNLIQTLVKNLISYPISAPDFFQSLMRRGVRMMICTDIANPSVAPRQD